LELQDVIAPSALKITPREINLGDKIARTFFVMSYPRVLTDSWFAPIINLDRVLDISIFIHPIDSADILKKFQKKVAEVQPDHGREEKGLVRDPVSTPPTKTSRPARPAPAGAGKDLRRRRLHHHLRRTAEELDKSRARSSRCSRAAGLRQAGALPAGAGL
jgi:hypothetical protein